MVVGMTTPEERELIAAKDVLFAASLYVLDHGIPGMRGDERAVLLDELDAADEHLLRALATGHPEWAGFGSCELIEAVIALRGSRGVFELDRQDREGVADALWSVLEALDGRAVVGGEWAAQVERAVEHIGTAMLVVDADRMREAVRTQAGAGDRVRAASRLELLELRLERSLKLAKLDAAGSPGTDKWWAFERRDPDYARELLARMEDPGQPVPQLLAELTTLTGMDPNQARAFIELLRP